MHLCNIIKSTANVTIFMLIISMFHKNIQYYYKLEGSSDTDWIQITSNEVILTNLDPGKYKLIIKFRNNSGNIKFIS